MFFALKFTLSFVVSFLILSFPVKKRPLFVYLYGEFAPQTKQTYKYIQQKGEALFESGVKKSKKVFENAVPNVESLPEINIKASSPIRVQIDSSLKKVKNELKDELIEQGHTQEEEAMLKKILKGAL